MGLGSCRTGGQGERSDSQLALGSRRTGGGDGALASRVLSSEGGKQLGISVGLPAAASDGVLGGGGVVETSVLSQRVLLGRRLHGGEEGWVCSGLCED